MKRTTLTAILSKTFKAGISWGAWVNYGKDSSTVVMGKDLRELFQDAQVQIERLRNDNPVLKKIVIVCRTCHGTGQIELGIYKNGYRKGSKKFKKCTDCRGLGRAEVT